MTNIEKELRKEWVHKNNAPAMTHSPMDLRGDLADKIAWEFASEFDDCGNADEQHDTATKLAASIRLLLTEANARADRLEAALKAAVADEPKWGQQARAALASRETK